MDNALIFSDWLKQRRRSLALTQEELARRAACSTATIRKLEAGDLVPSKELARLLAVALTVPEHEQAAFIAFARTEAKLAAASAFAITSPSTFSLPALPFITLPPAFSSAVELPPIPLPTPFSTSSPLPKYTLPAQLTSLVGREQECLTGVELIRRAGVRLVTLTGPPGTGKTRLALALAEAVQQDFADGVCFVPLAPLSDVALVPSAIAQALGVRSDTEQLSITTLKSYLRDKTLLLLLDNFEQLLPAANLLIELLQAAPLLKILVTSRALLKVYGEHDFSVPPLTLPDEKQAPSVVDLLACSAVALFVQRAEAVQPTFCLTPDNAQSVVQICARLAGLPLAIEMAAARVKLYPPRALLAQLGQQLATLSSQLRNLPARQQTLRGAIAWSYNLLAPEEQQRFALCGVFVGGCTLDAMNVLHSQVVSSGMLPGLLETGHEAGLEQTQHYLHALVDHSLLQIKLHDDGETRYQMLEILREYAAERLRLNGQWTTAQHAHALYYGALAEQAAPYLNGVEQQRWLTQLDQEHDNLRAALHWCYEEDVHFGLRIATALSEFWFARSYFAEGSHQLLRLLARPAAQQANLLRARALCAAGLLVERQGNYGQALTMIEESLALCEQAGDALGVAKALGGLGLLAFYQNDYARAQVCYDQALALYRAQGDRGQVAITLHQQGLLAKDQGDYARAYAILQEGLAVAQHAGSLYIVGRIYNSLALVTFWQGEFARAAAFSQQSVALHRQVGDKHGLGHALENLGAISRRRGEFAQAQHYFAECLALFQASDDKVGVLITLDDLGLLAATQNQLWEASQFHRQSLTLAWQIQEKRYMAFSLERLAYAAHFTPRAVKLYSAAAALRLLIHAPVAPIDQEPLAARLDGLRAHLGESDFASAWAAGQALTLEQAVHFALAE